MFAGVLQYGTLRELSIITEYVAKFGDVSAFPPHGPLLHPLTINCDLTDLWIARGEDGALSWDRLEHE